MDESQMNPYEYEEVAFQDLIEENENENENENDNDENEVEIVNEKSLAAQLSFFDRKKLSENQFQFQGARVHTSSHKGKEEHDN
jgi:hypothetical protein